MGASTVSCHAAAPVHDTGTTYRTIAVVGPPNSGKTTLFNRLTKLRQKVGNFPGVTVEHHTGYIRDANGEEVALVDLPGVYSLTPKSEDEKVAVDVLTGKMPGMPPPDAVIVVLIPTTCTPTWCWPRASSRWACPPWCCSTWPTSCASRMAMWTCWRWRAS